MTADQERLQAHFPCVMLVVDAERAAPDALCRAASKAVVCGVNVVQLRAKRLATPGVIALGRRLQDAIAGRALLFINSDLDAVAALDADGVHLPEDAPEFRPSGVLVSRAVHGVDAARRAKASGADLLIAGTVFPSASHPGGAPLGIAGLRAICDAVAAPVIGIGGITPANAADVMSADAAGVAVIGAVFDAADAGAAAAALRAAIRSASAPGQAVEDRSRQGRDPSLRPG